jgi:hypothetical protein
MSDQDDAGYDSLNVPADAVFVAYDDPVRVFPSIAAAERELESMGLEGDAYPVAYGPKGEVYTVRSEAGCIHIELSDRPNRPGELKELLLHYLECCEDPGDATDTLECLVTEAWSVERDYWLRNRPVGELNGGRLSALNWIGFAAVAAAVLYLLLRAFR